MSKGKVRRFCLALLIIQLFILTFLCPALALAKVLLFDQTNGELNYNKGVEYSYIALTCSTAAISFLAMCCFCIFNMKDFRLLTILTSIAWFILPIIYTVYTIHEIDPIPFNCQYDFQYPVSKTACGIRAANFVFMWLYLAYAIFSLIIMVSLMFEDGERPHTDLNEINNEITDEEKDDKSDDVV
ncbi:hypothetical protein F8M41_023868 [Gigaspora margarita]|uniref:Uncharacterized protein n=1 Tax=Gigaspora margarita TaxID=4874 RepID=A0A8H4EGD8_GIGMA|nr:hypothetical protein F8M41_023868 [Gigaspora margarita]